ncbi:MAG: shikimate kinase [Firmicutes bacterium]|nr:shikimate kinase [[Eubacterium] siraeum]MCM1488648.1 shikimate kinase [Bacillota bacterium]
MESIYLCGFMGCGKSHIGKLLSKLLKMPFVDLDSYIVKKENMTIPQIFEEKGEPYFRQLEADCLKELQEGYIVATGGGTLINPDTAKYAAEHGKTVFLDASFPVCYGRIKNDANRPLVVNNTREQLYQIYLKRRKIYKANSQITVKAEGKGNEIANSIIHSIVDQGKNLL